jgi:citrate synthase
MTNPFWRDTPLNESETILLEKTLDAHRAATFRQNLSSEVVKAAFAGNGHDFTKAAAAGLCTLGGLHAPIVQTYEFLDNITTNPAIAMDCYIAHNKIPGWGSSFVKGKPDPVVDNVVIYIATGWKYIADRIDYVTNCLHQSGKNVFPNMACITAATAIILGIPKELSPVLLLQGRVMAWAELIYESSRTTPPQLLRADPR